MPFDVSGNFSRLYNFTQDRNNGIKILASRVDGEFDNVSAGLNQVLFRTGFVAMTGDLNMGLNRVIGLGDGAVGNPALKWSSDPLSGLFLNGYGRVAVSATGVKVAEFTQSGGTITGGLSVTGPILQNGAQVWHSNNFSPASYQPVLGYTPANRAGDTFNGPVTLNGGITTANSGIITTTLTASGVIAGNGGYTGSSMALTGALSAQGSITQSGQQVWHAGNLDPSIYALRSGTDFTGAIRQNGQQVWHAGNLNPNLYAPVNNPIFTGSGITVGQLGLVASASPTKIALDNSYSSTTGQQNRLKLQLAFDGGSYYGIGVGPAGAVEYHAGAGHEFYVNGTQYAQFNSSGFVRSNAGQFSYQDTVGRSGRMSRGTAAPSGGSDGDMYFQYT